MSIWSKKPPSFRAAVPSPPELEEAASDRHAIIAERVARVQAGGAATLSIDEVEQSLREDLDF